MKKNNVLILCTGNSCRSQMAEALINHDLGEQWQAFSAGTAPSGYVHPKSIEVMAELGIDLSQHHSKNIDVFAEETFAAVITVCDSAKESCPVWLGNGGVVTHIGFPDPAGVQGGEQAVLAVFRQVRDDIRAQIIPYLRDL